MKRLCGFALLWVLALAGCHQSTPGGTKDLATNVGNAEGPALAPPKSDQPGPAPFTPETRSLVSSSDVPLLEQIDRESEKVVGAAMPSIVRIIAMGPIDAHEAMMSGLPFKMPFGPGMPANHPNVPSYGSGVIISKDGYIVTNAHVLEGAQSVEVQLSDQRSFPARIVAADTPLDVAVVKIRAAGLPALPWGDSDKLEVGEQVFAIGNPFNFDDSVTRGIISAKERSLPDSSYGDYIQTDASINVGNSGGALVNIHGQLVGINAAIASYTRGNEGVGFSIPSNLVRYAVEALLKQGRIVRGYLGVMLPAKIDGGVVEQLGLASGRGALLAGIQRRSPADVAKLEPVDFITAVDGHKIDGVLGLRMVVAQIPVGKQVVVDYIRDGAPRSTVVKIAELPSNLDSDAASDPEAMPDLGGETMPVNPVRELSPADTVLGGLQVANLDDKTRQKYGIDDLVTSGVVITNVQAGSPADSRGLLPGDVIQIASAERGSTQPLANAGDFTGLAKKLKPDQSVVLLVHGKNGGMENRSSMFIFLGNQPR